MFKYFQGRFTPKNPHKYKGNVRNIIYRSSWELTFLNYCDTNANVIEYASEEIVIPYRSPIDGKVHRYFVDFYIKVREKTGEIKQYLIEIKPKKQTIAPNKNPKRKTKYWKQSVFEYAKNVAKWDAAKDWCEDRSMTFKILTEEDLGL